MSTAELSALVSRLEAVTSRLERIPLSGGAGAAEVSSETLDEFDVVLGGKFKEYFDLSVKLGGEVAEHAALVKQAFKLEREIIATACKHKAPKPDVSAKVVKPLGDKVNEIVAFCEKRRGSKVFNNLMTIKEGIGCVGWVSVSPKPAPYVKEMYDQALFYGNRVIKEFKGKDDQQVSWVRAFTGGIQELQAYVKKYHTTGLVWNKEGPECSVAPAAPAGGGPPPPPPPAIQPPSDAPSTGGSDQSAQRANLFASINKGGDITKGLRKVTDDMKTHKNPELRASSVVKAADKPTAKATPKAASAPAVKKPPVCALQGKKWVVEYQEGNKNLSITDTSTKQSVYVFRCNNSTLRVTGKVNSIILDNCKRMALCFDDVISSVEIINCQGAQVQVTGKCPTVSIDKTDGCQVFLSKDSITAEIITAKSSEMNICIPKGDAGDFSEHALPEQFKTVWNGKQFVTECSDI